MSVDRIATSNQTTYMTSQLLKQEAKVGQYSAQVASGQVSTSYSGYGSQVQALESARGVVNRTAAYQTATSYAISQVGTQDTYLSQLDTTVSDLMSDVGTAISSGDATTLTASVQSALTQIASILNSQDSSGNYIFGGGNNSSEPVTASTFDDLLANTDEDDISGAFADGTSVKSVQVSDTQTIDTGVLASDAGSDVLSVIRKYADYIGSLDDGDFGSTLTTDDENFLSTFCSDIKDAYSTVTNVEGKNGDVYSSLEDAADTKDALLTTYKGFVSNIQDVDMTTAADNLSNSQTALQAVVQVTSSLNDISLLDYLS
jgi:flagellar hook-associated protein 3 FlgL